MANKLLVFLFIAGLSLVSRTLAHNALCKGVAYNRFVRDPDSCRNYFLCRNDRAIPGWCENNLHFDYDMQMCRYPEVVGCEITTPAPTTTPEGPIEQWVCIGREHGSFCADPRRCGSFFVCRNQIGTPGNCPHRHWFHPIFLFCTNPAGFCRPRENVCDNGVDSYGRNCEDRETTTIRPTESTTITTPTTTEVATTTPAGPIELWICIGRLDNTFRHHPHRCGSYFVCRQSIGIRGDCPRRFWFHPERHYCTNPNVGFCVPQERCDNGSDQNGVDCEEDRETTTAPDSTTVTIPSTETDSTTIATTTEVDTTTPSGPIELWICIGRPDNSFRHHPRRCGSYFLCRQAIGHMAHCPRRFWFHPVFNFCTNPNIGFCVPQERCDNGSNQNGGDCDDDLETTTTATTTVAPITTTPSGPIELWVCIGMVDNAFTRHPRRCGSFFLCIGQVGFPGDCPRRFWFHPTLHICTSPGNFCQTEETCDNGVGTNCPHSSEESSSESKSEESKESKECDSNSNSGSDSSGSDSSDSSDSNSNDSRCSSGEVDRSGPIESWICIGVSNSRLVAHPHACGTFFLCMSNVGLSVQCPFSEWFNPTAEICMVAGAFCTSTLPCDNGVGSTCTDATTEDPIVTPPHSTVAR